MPARRSAGAARRREASEENNMDGLETVPGAQKCVVIVFYTCVFCGAVEVIHVPREVGLPLDVPWECVTCHRQVDGTRRKRVS